MSIYNSLRPIIFKLDEEKAHNLAIFFLKNFPNLATIWTPQASYKNLQQKLWNLDFTSPIGMAAGFDKNAETLKALQKFGFGFIEAGTVTINPQAGNDKQRLFRLQEDEAIINRLGFNNKGWKQFMRNVKSYKNSIPLGINVGKNKDSKDDFSDYVFLLEKFYEASSYLVLNISSPNTKNLRELQNSDNLHKLLSRVTQKKMQLEKFYDNHKPLWLKVAPDLTIAQQEEIVKIALQYKIDALVVGNTTISRDFNLKSAHSNEAGGLSGKPLFSKSNEVLRNMYKMSEGKIIFVGVGGISNAQDVYEKIKYGASLVQIYSAFIYQGFGAVEKIKKELSELVKKDGFENISQAIGSNTFSHS